MTNRLTERPAQSIRPTTPVPTIILAGGISKPDLQTMTGQSNRSLVVVAGKTLLRHVVDAALTANAQGGPLGPVVVIGNVPASEDYACIPDTGDFVANVFAGLGRFPDAPYVLFATSDLPFLTGTVVGEFVQGADMQGRAENADLVWPIVPVQVCYARFPGVKRTALRLREGEFTGGNLALVRPGFLLTHRERIGAAYEARKDPLKLAQMLGLGTAARLFLSQKLMPKLLTIPFLEERVGRLLGGRACAYVSQSPELATDLDRPSDFSAIGYVP